MQDDLSVIIIGSFTLDRINEGLSIGGPAYYSSLALTYLGHSSITVISPAREIHENFVKNIGINLINVGTDTPVFQLKYVEGGRREVILKHRGSKIIISKRELDLIRDSLIIISPVYREIDLDTLKTIRKFSKFIALDVQGFVRYVCSDGKVSIAWTNEMYEVIRLADVVHADLSEVPIYNDMVEASRELGRLSNGIIMVSNGERGLVASINGELYYVPALPGIEGNATGTGDILLAISAYEILMGENPLRAIAKGAVAAGLRVGRDRSPWFNKYEVDVLADKLVRKSEKLSMSY